jgi:hypothetical protein
MLWDIQQLADDGCPNCDLARDGEWRALTLDEFTKLKAGQRIRSWSIYGGAPEEHVVKESPYWSEYRKCWFVVTDAPYGVLSLWKASRLVEVWCGEQRSKEAA